MSNLPLAPFVVTAAPDLRELAVARIALQAGWLDARSSVAEERWLARALNRAGGPDADLFARLEASVEVPCAHDAALVALARELRLTRLELLAVVTAMGVEEEAWLGRALARLQAPVGGSRPTLGLLAAAFGSLVPPGVDALASLVTGPAVESGLLVLGNSALPLPERNATVPLHLCLALRGRALAVPGTSTGLRLREAVRLPASVRAVLAAHARSIAAEPGRGLLLRTAGEAEGRTAAALVARALGRRPLFLRGEPPEALGPWLHVSRLLPVWELSIGPGERSTLPRVPGWDGPCVALAGSDGTVEVAGGSVVDWRLPLPAPAERARLWRSAIGAEQLAQRLGGAHRHGAGRIAHLGRLARHLATADGRRAPTERDVAAASWSGEGGWIELLAEPIRERVPDEAFVRPDALCSELEALCDRCRARESLAAGLGRAASTRYAPGVKALFVGPSGVGKTLAASWLATRLDLPLLRIDVAAVTSKWYGETEKHLARLLALGERAEVVLLFDEADSCFGKRTDVHQANDRMMNAQTNVLLTKIESYEGIAVLTSNSAARIDPAFARRLDFVLDFPPPGPEQRRALWSAHLGDRHALTVEELNRLASRAELSGGAIRNVVLGAATAAAAAGRERIEPADVGPALEREYRKLGERAPTSVLRER